MEGVHRRPVDCVVLTSDEPLSRDLETVEEDYTPVAEPNLVDWPAIVLRPFLRCGRMVLSQLIKVPVQEGAAWDLRNASNGSKIDIEEMQVDQS